MTTAEKYYHSLLTFGIMPGLDRIKILLQRLGNPQISLRCIHVAGTNGKGTVCSFLSSVLTEAGYKTGLYTSPYIVDFRERIRIDGEMISETDLNAVTEKVKEQIEFLQKENIIITEFEAVTAAAFLYYKEQNCDFVVLETGLGGRFDATNVIEHPLVSVIVSISLDHVNILGNTIAEIAFEKCGIIKKGCPVVTNSEQLEDALNVIKEQSIVNGSELVISDVSKISIIDESIKGSNIFFDSKNIFVPFPGLHQVQNCATALKTISLLKQQGIVISEKSILNGISKTKNPARCEVISENPLVIFDGCHNEDSAKALKTILENHLKGRNITAVMGMMADKDIEKVLELLMPHFTEVFTVPVNNPRAVTSKELAEKIKSLGKNAKAFKNVICAYEKAVANSQKEDVVIVCGSLYLCSELYSSIPKSQLTETPNTSESATNS